MIPVLLTVENLLEENAQYKFNNGKTFFKLKEAVAIKQALGYAIFGNSTLFQGKVELSFKHNEENYIIDRDFASNKVQLSDNKAIKTDAKEINKFMASIIGYNANQWEEFVIADKDDNLDRALSDVNQFVKDNFTNLSIDAEVLNDARERTQRKINDIKAQIAVLNDMHILSVKEIGDNIVTAKEDVAGIKAELARLNEFIVEGRSLIKLQDEYDKVKYQIEKEQQKDNALISIINKIDYSEKMEKAIFMYEKNNEATVLNGQLEKQVADLTIKLKELEKVISKGEKAQLEKEKSFIALNENVKQLNIALDNTIETNVASGELDQSVFVKAEAYYTESKEKIKQLRESLEKEQARLKVVNYDLDKDKVEFNENHYGYRHRADIREGASFEGMLAVKKQRFDQLNAELAKVQKTLEDFRNQKQSNANIEENSKNEEQKLNDEGGYDNFFESYNALESNKQELYRGQIISAGILGELKAIDHKIFDNQQARQSYVEDLTALNNAKNILMQYIAKCEDKLCTQNEKLTGFMAKQEYFKEVDDLEFGDPCPVCKGNLLDKTDMSIDNTRLSTNIKKQLEEIEKTKIILDEYTNKLEKINVRLGNLNSKEITSANYIESLKSTKDAKIAARDSIYKECGVKSHEELTEKVETAVKSILEYSNRLAKINQAAGIKNFSADSNKLLDKYIELMEKHQIPALKQELEAVTADIESFKEQYKDIKGRLEDKTATEQLDGILNFEKREDVLIRNINSSLEEKALLEKNIARLNKEIDTLSARKAAVKINGKTYDYEELCVMLTGKTYQDILGEIRKVEAKRQEAQDEFVAIKRLLNEKKESFNDISKQIDELLKQAEVNVKYIESLNKNSGFDPSELKDKNIETIRQSILGEDEKQIMQTSLDEHALRMGSLSYQSDALKSRLENGKDYIEKFKSNCQEFKELQDLLDQKMEQDKVLVKELAVADALSTKVSELQLSKTENERALQTVDSAISESLSEELIAYMNNVLRKLSQKYYVKQDGKSLAVAYTDKKGDTKLMDKLSEVDRAIVSLAVIEAIGTVLGSILDVKCVPRIINMKASLFNEKLRQNIAEEVSNKGMLLLFNK